MHSGAEDVDADSAGTEELSDVVADDAGVVGLVEEGERGDGAGSGVIAVVVLTAGRDG